MTELTTKERELVAIGAAIGSNCVPCIKYHISEAKKAGLSDTQIFVAIQIADTVKKVPAQKVIQVALGLLEKDGNNKLSRMGLK
jgi:4-carboxymuconolactone decarboxylase